MTGNTWKSLKNIPPTIFFAHCSSLGDSLFFFFNVKDQTPSMCFISPSCLPSCSHCSLSPAPSPGLVQLVSFHLKQIAPNLYFSLEHEAGGGGGGGAWKLEVFQTSALHYASI